MESMRDLLRGSLARSLEAVPELDRLDAAWTVACGRTLAARGRIAGFSGGRLRVEVDDPAWLDQMQAMAPMLTQEIARIAGIRVAAIHFSLGSPKE
jgi:hypothetical protein